MNHTNLDDLDSYTYFSNTLKYFYNFNERKFVEEFIKENENLWKKHVKGLSKEYQEEFETSIIKMFLTKHPEKMTYKLCKAYCDNFKEKDNEK